MPHIMSCLVCVMLLMSAAAARADDVSEASTETPKEAPGATEELPPLTPEAEQAVAELRASLPPDSEAIAMLDAILEGSRLGPDEGWFKLAFPQTRYTWDSVAAQYDADQNGMITSEEFGGDDAGFTRLDRDGDQGLTAADLDLSGNSLNPTPGLLAFFTADADANGKVTVEEFATLFARLDTDQQGFLALDDLRDQFQLPPQSNTAPRPDAPSRSTLILGLKRQEIGSLQPGPALDEAAPDFTLQAIDGREVTLSQQVGEHPIVLIFGNFTCGPFRSQAGNIEKLYERYKDRAKFFLIYVREAHPTDGWWMTSNQRVGIDLPQPTSDAERLVVAATCRAHLGLDDSELPFLVDTVDDKVGATYSGMPNRLYLIDREGKIAFKNGRGPFGFKPRELEQALVLMLNE
jgi:hypothetical protein